MNNLFSILITIFFIFLIAGLAKFIKIRWTVPARGYTQLSLLVISEIAFICNKGIACENCPLSFGICPVGTVQRAAFIKQFPLHVLIILIGITGIIFGTFACGWTCPIGFIQDLFTKSSPVKNKIRIPKLIKKGRYLSLIILSVLIYIELQFKYFSNLGINVLNEIVLFGGTILLATAFFLKRPFCKVLCPFGLIYGKLNKLSPIKVRLNKCSGCEKCYENCITDIKPPSQLNGDLCAKCFNCQVICNKNQAVLK